MATRKFRFKHIAQDASQHVGDAGDLILDTTLKTLKVSDGSTAGGKGLAPSYEINDNSDSGTTLDPNAELHILSGDSGNGGSNITTYILGDGTYVGQTKVFIIDVGDHRNIKLSVAKFVDMAANVSTVANKTAFSVFQGSEVRNTCTWNGNGWAFNQI